jgi:hypothetical protein
MPVFEFNMYKALTGSNKKTASHGRVYLYATRGLAVKITGGIFMFRRIKNDNTLKKV